MWTKHLDRPLVRIFLAGVFVISAAVTTWGFIATGKEWVGWGLPPWEWSVIGLWFLIATAFVEFWRLNTRIRELDARKSEAARFKEACQRVVEAMSAVDLSKIDRYNHAFLYKQVEIEQWRSMQLFRDAQAKGILLPTLPVQRSEGEGNDLEAWRRLALFAEKEWPGATMQTADAAISHPLAVPLSVAHAISLVHAVVANGLVTSGDQ